MVKRLKALTGFPYLAYPPDMEILRIFLRLVFLQLGLSLAPILYGGVDNTLVSWVILEDTSVQAGSILTLQSDSEFDGIVFGELMENKWMAGSDNWKRSEKNQKNTRIRIQKQVHWFRSQSFTKKISFPFSAMGILMLPTLERTSICSAKRIILRSLAKGTWEVVVVFPE